ncbi:DNA damage-inducible protein DinB [Chryseobacterium lactis]|uniref:DNA damage-inducible protein DinB n=1 Tax=Chryseobacterium lactis TaxID=1241981 RepID=A0A3G6RQE9_CHRLC|nr:DinB family protein [Chryseobacterium lactis]AZA84879.1 DinB family protein [Chryseobacterium lactis]AZB05267.1 DinB family protein [Chryseobacterium lactis]PNW12250.1 DNA damage-inducible protein DinB [Chryseobacterium lactis]
MTDFQKYIQRYLDQIPSGDWLKELKISGEKTLGIYSNLTEEQSKFSYAEGKWTLKELLLHLSDTERVFQYRMLAFARGDKNNLPGFDENEYAEKSFANERTLESLVEEYKLVRKSSQILSETLNSSALQTTGVANGNEITVETIGKLIVGHNIHHLNIIEERYLPKLGWM